MKRDRGGAAANAANSPLSAAQGREADPWQRKFRFAPQTRTAGLSRGRSVGDVATAGPRGVYAAPPAADLPHSGGVRRHRRYVLAPLIPQPWPCRSMAAPRRRSELLFRIGRSHRVGCAFDPPARVVPYTTCSGAICGGSDLFWRNLRGNAISYQRLRVRPVLSNSDCARIVQRDPRRSDDSAHPPPARLRRQVGSKPYKGTGCVLEKHGERSEEGSRSFAVGRTDLKTPFPMGAAHRRGTVRYGERVERSSGAAPPRPKGEMG
jgi:hypothetical protein